MKILKNESVKVVLLGLISSMISMPLTAIINSIYMVWKSSAIPLSIQFLIFLKIAIIIILSIFLSQAKKRLKQIDEDIVLFRSEIKQIYSNTSSLQKELEFLFNQAQHIEILDLRGFLYTQQDSKLFRIIAARADLSLQVLLSSPTSGNTKYRATHIPQKTFDSLAREIQSSIDTLLCLNRANIKVRTYGTYNVVRLIFIDNELFLTPFRNENFISSALTLRMDQNSHLYKCYRDYYVALWDTMSDEANIGDVTYNLII